MRANGMRDCVMDGDRDLPERTFGWWDMFVHEDHDPRADGGWNNDERSVLLGFLSDRRITLELKCAGLDAEQMTRRSVPPSDLSLLGLVGHLTNVETYWFQHVIAGRDGEQPNSEAAVDSPFDVEPDPVVVDRVWLAWRDEVALSELCMQGISDMGQQTAGSIPVREVLVHVIREYAQHLGHADLIRERIDGRVGQ